MALTLHQINYAIWQAGIDAEVVRGESHLYYSGPAVEYAYTTTAQCTYINQRTLEEWVHEAIEFANDSLARSPE